MFTDVITNSKGYEVRIHSKKESIEELYRQATRDFLTIKNLQTELDIERSMNKVLNNRIEDLKFVIREANNSWFFGKPNLEIPQYRDLSR